MRKFIPTGVLTSLMKVSDWLSFLGFFKSTNALSEIWLEDVT